ncbi:MITOCHONDRIAL 28S ribosomal protein S29 [Anaeramoeba ignava]|uniref:Small ribosomal subunit protein mS29 n=1 Tax=Anaeramoeba ignava TaxID=1746090 RepID=A0A9Q0RGU6_ANAIG|nr:MITOCHONDRIAL 28S ribosomal protein S29 [Anaeramoeba ignava]
MEIEINENISKNQDSLTLDVLPFKDHLKQENCNRVILVKNIFENLPTGMKKSVIGNYIPIMIRNQTQKFIRDIAQKYIPEFEIDQMNTRKIIIHDLESNTKQIVPQVKPPTNAILAGPSGAGKSYMLFHIAYFCSQLEKWFVLYIPQFADLRKQPSHKAARFIVRNLYKLYKKELFEFYKFPYDEKLWDIENPNENQKNQMFQTCTNLLSNLTLGFFEKHHILIAIDQWNVLFRPKESKESKEDEHVLDFFKVFRSIPNGLFITAVSSTFDPVDKLQDADYVTYKQNVELYNEMELESMINHQKMLHYIPQKRD